MGTVETFDMKIFDKEALMTRLCDDEELVTEVVNVYLEDTPNQIQTLREAHSNGDQDQIVRQGHTIKGASSNVSALRMRVIAIEIEKAGKSGEMDIIPSLLGELEDQFRSLQEFLSK